ncbi:hypothetical protein GQ53DRAFT_742635 [Thozetella sp. PMI_491]|nr:hypothetical protein GQ53DRAFT_742635 [Thozetella sp. PMI_491]
MASKCWFVLKQTHYPPPTLPKNGFGHVNGPICPGHLIPDLKHLDNVINRRGHLDITSDIPIYPTQSWDLTWETNRSKGGEVAGDASIPIAAAAGVTVKLEAGSTFQRTTKNFWQFESLETFIFQPSGAYVEDSLECDEVVEYLKRRGPLRSSSLFMITGIIVARGAQIRTEENVSKDFRICAGAEVPAIAGAGAKFSAPSESGLSSSAKKTSDFVWAVRLAKITKGVVDRLWRFSTVSSGATFSNEEEAPARRITEALEAEDLGSLEIPALDVTESVFIVLDSQEA